MYIYNNTRKFPSFPLRSLVVDNVYIHGFFFLYMSTNRR